MICNSYAQKPICCDLALRAFIKTCDTCQRNKVENILPMGLLQPLPIPTRNWQDISMDLIEGLPPSGGRIVIMVVIDGLSKYAHFMSLSHPYTATTVARVLMDNIFKLRGFPLTIVSDRDPVFTSHFWKEMFKISGTELLLNSAYHPQTNGQIEVMSKTLEGYLRSIMDAVNLGRHFEGPGPPICKTPNCRNWKN